jgi:hypothetical protein
MRSRPDSTKREALAETIDAYAAGCMSEEFMWAVGPQSPVLLHHLMHAIDVA